MSVSDQYRLPGDVLMLDIGKTHTKISRRSGGVFGAPCAGSQVTIRSPQVHAGPFPAIDTKSIWNWCTRAIAQMPDREQIRAILPVTHGASFALLAGDELAFPVMDYEFRPDADLVDRYDRLRPALTQTGSPRMPAMLNAGQQLFYLERTFPDRFASVDGIVPLAQYFAFLFSGVLRNEVSGLGCHTDLWEPLGSRFSRMVIDSGWERRFPPLSNAFSVVGHLQPPLAESLGLTSDVAVLAGCHDSSFEFAAAVAGAGTDIATLSTGTWFVVTTKWRPGKRPKLADEFSLGVSANGDPTISARFMGGRLVEKLPKMIAVEDLRRTMESGTIARLPGSAKSDGSGHELMFFGPLKDEAAVRAAAGQLFLVFQASDRLNRLGAPERVVLSGPFAGHPAFSALLQLAQRGRRRMEAPGNRIMPGWITGDFASDDALMAGYHEIIRAT